MIRKRSLFVLGIVVMLWNFVSIHERLRQPKGGRPLQSSPVGLAPCGQVCTYTAEVVKDTGGPYPQLYKEIICADIMRRMAYRNHTILNPPPAHPPESMLQNFTMNQNMPITKIKYYRPGSSTAVRTFSKAYVAGLMTRVRDGLQVNTYKSGRCVELTLKRYEKDIAGKRGVVIGTLQPWLEAVLLAYGASQVSTLEYSKLELEDDRLRVFTPYDFADRYVSGDAEPFDFGATFSSMEHSGLGRYTDPLNPFGDFEAMAQVWCMMKPGGMFMLGLPCSRRERGFILWNANRVYGQDRLQHMTANWQLLEVVSCSDAHNLFVLRKPKQQ